MRPTPLDVPAAVLLVLQAWIDDSATGAVPRLRARIVVLSAQGLGPACVAAELGCSAQTVTSWRERFRRRGLDGLRDAPRSGRPVSVDPAMVIRATVAPRGPGAARWSSRSLGEHLGVSNVTVANVWRAWGLRPGTTNPVDLRTKPVLDRTPHSVLGLYADAEVRIAALRVRGDRGGHAGSDEPSAMRRVGIGGRLSTLLGLVDGAGDGVLDDFLCGVERLAARAEPVDPSAPVRLIVGGAAEVVGKWAADRALVGVHVVPPELSWERIVRVACVLTGAGDTDGPASLEALRAAVDRYPGTGPFSWTAG